MEKLTALGERIRTVKRNTKIKPLAKASELNGMFSRLPPQQCHISLIVFKSLPGQMTLGLWPGPWKPGPQPGLKEKKPTQLDPPRHFLYEPCDGLNRQVRGPTRVVAPSSSHIEKLDIYYACGLKKDLKILPPNALREFRSIKSRLSGRKGRSGVFRRQYWRVTVGRRK
jgi:hypothetical protein